MHRKGKFHLLGIIGSPLRQTMSPTLHNYWITKNNINGNYVPLELSNLKNIDKAIKAMNFTGLNVTIPYKKSILKYLDKLDEDAGKLESVNTIVNRKGKLIGYNTDTIGFQKGLKKLKKWNKNLPVLVIGAGGAAEAIVYSLCKIKIKQIYLMNRTTEKAKKIGCKYKNIKIIRWLENDLIDNFSMIINTTSLGMVGYPKLPISLKEINKNTIVYDIVYNPLKTPLIKEAKKNNMVTIDGLEMFLEQAKESFGLWFNKYPEIDTQILKLIKNKIEKQ
tara:strand:+ start:6501 stop:7331 length:831 start_codon:yes stop_codon:yes gene_type:complete